VPARQAKVQPWEEVQRTYRHHVETLSLTLPPCCIADSTPHTSDQVASRLPAAVEAMAALARHPQWPARSQAMQKGHKQLPALAALVDFWGQGVWQEVESFALAPRWRPWVPECLLPLVYWANQATHTRCARNKAQILPALPAVRAVFDTHTITRRLDRQGLAEWQAWARLRVQVLARASAAVEGRHGYWSQMHHQQRGWPKQRYKVWTGLPNFDCRAADGTTPAARFFRRSFPDLFETVLSNIDALPRPRQRNYAMALTG
jgi:hypothetical protein